MASYSDSEKGKALGALKFLNAVDMEKVVAYDRLPVLTYVKICEKAISY